MARLPAGDAVGDEFQVYQHMSDGHGSPAISHNLTGGFTVGWQSSLQDGSAGYGVLAAVIPAALVTTGPAAGGGSQVRRFQED